MKAISLLLASSVAFVSTVVTVSALPGDYKEIQCSTQAFFSANSCNQCFDGGKITVGQKLTGFYDTWTNKNSTEQIAYRDEQSFPEMVNLGGAATSWKATPDDPKNYWKYGTEVVWVDALTGSGKQEYTLDPSKTVTFMEADLGANYSLEKSDVKDGEFVGLMKFPVAYHDLDAAGKDGALQSHVECVAFAASAPAPAVAPTPKPVPQVTKVKTGPESFLLLAIAALVSLSFLAFRRKKAQ